MFLKNDSEISSVRFEYFISFLLSLVFKSTTLVNEHRSHFLRKIIQSSILNSIHNEIQ